MLQAADVARDSSGSKTHTSIYHPPPLSASRTPGHCSACPRVKDSRRQRWWILCYCLECQTFEDVTPSSICRHFYATLASQHHASAAFPLHCSSVVHWWRSEQSPQNVQTSEAQDRRSIISFCNELHGCSNCTTQPSRLVLERRSTKASSLCLGEKSDGGHC